MIPEWTAQGYLPVGIHKAEWQEFTERFGWNDHRKTLLSGLEMLLKELGRVRCKTVYVDGSFVTTKEYPNDYDLCWGVDKVLLDQLDPILLTFSEQGKKQMESKYFGDIRPAEFGLSETSGSYLEFFQMDRDGNSKGIVKLRPCVK